MTTFTLQRPVAGQTQIIAPQNETELHFDFDVTNTTFTREDNTLNITFSDGAAITLTDFYSTFSNDALPELYIANQAIDSEQFFSSMGETIIPAAGTTVSPLAGSGNSVQIITETLNQGIDRLAGINNTDEANNEQNSNIEQSINHVQPASNTETTTPATNQIVLNINTPVAVNTETLTQTQNQLSAEPEVPTQPEIPTSAFFTQADTLAADAGSRLTGNLLANDTLPEGATITNIIVPNDWSVVHNDDGSMTFTYNNDSLTTFTVQNNGDYVLSTNFNNALLENAEFSYEVQDQSGAIYTAQVSVGNNNDQTIYVETLQGGSAHVTTDDGNSYVQEFSSYANDSDIHSQHVNGMLLGSGNDTMHVETAIGSQTNPYYAGVGDTFIYGDALRVEDQGQAGNDTIHITTLDGTKIRADGNLYNDVRGGDDTVNVENMEGGSIIGDGWTLHDNAQGGDDIINVGTMNSGEIYGDGVSLSSRAQGGDDIITVDNIDTTLNGNQSIVINGNHGDDTINIGSIESNSGDSIRIDGGLGSDLFNFDSSADDTMAMLGNQIYIAGQGQINITNFEGIASGAGNDLVKLYDRTNNELDFSDLFVDTGEGMDVLLGNHSNLDEFTTLIENDDVVNTEYVVLSDDLNNASTTSNTDLFNKLEDEGVTQESDGSLNFDNSWTQGENVGNFDSYTNADQDITILVARTQIETSMA